MAQIRTCDRCGKPIVAKKDFVGLKIIPFIRVKFWFDDYSDYFLNSKKSFDLCSNCYDELKEWLNQNKN